MPNETLTSLAFEVAPETKEGALESPRAKTETTEGAKFTTKQLERRAGEIITKLYEALGDDLTPILIGKPKEELPIVALNSRGMVIFPDSGELFLPPELNPKTLEMFLKQPVSTILNPENGDWGFVQIQKPEPKDISMIFDETTDDLSIHNIRERAPMDTGEQISQKDIAKMRTQVMRYLSGAIPNSIEVKELELGPEKERIRIEKNEKGKTVLIDNKGQERSLKEFPDDVVSLYQTYFPGPSSGEEELGISAASATREDETKLEELETQVVFSPQKEKQLLINSSDRKHSLYMELVGPAEAVNRMAEKEHKKFRLKTEKPNMLPEELRKLHIRPVIIGVGGRMAVFYDYRADSTILCLKGPDKKWTAVRTDYTPSREIDSLLDKLEINN